MEALRLFTQSKTHEMIEYSKYAMWEFGPKGILDIWEAPVVLEIFIPLFNEVFMPARQANSHLALNQFKVLVLNVHCELFIGVNRG